MQSFQKVVMLTSISLQFSSPNSLSLQITESLRLNFEIHAFISDFIKIFKD